MSYIVLDLEWNQAMSSHASIYNHLPIHLNFRWFLHQHRPPTDRKATEQFLDRAMERGYYTFD